MTSYHYSLLTTDERFILFFYLRATHSSTYLCAAAWTHSTCLQGEIPGSPIFVMKLAPLSRHLEVQLLADQYGDAIALSGRDCSVQRRHQKIVEEGPQTCATPAVWKQMEQAAVRLAKEVGYVNAGTVEWLYDIETGGFYFLELNPRLQVGTTLSARAQSLAR